MSGVHPEMANCVIRTFLSPAYQPYACGKTRDENQGESLNLEPLCLFLDGHQIKRREAPL
ncbi:MAG: hypothetical protein CSA23_06355 [Deltaproteobacteria bacterium]|nr:MAG: hypothetical protein CSA23_06355 [Deltaproteobacteria bacterium]